MGSLQLHNEGVEMAKNGHFSDSIYNFIRAYEINDANNEAGHLFRLADAAVASSNYRFAKLIYEQCYGKIKNVNLWRDAYWNMREHMSSSEFSRFCAMLRNENFPIESFIRETDIMINFISHKMTVEGSLANIDKEKELLNFKYVDKGSDKLIMAFTSRGSRGFQQTNLLRDVEADILFVRDVEDAWYNRGLKFITSDVDTTLNFLKKYTDRHDKILCTGISSGGYAALLFGSLLNADNIIAYSPQTYIPRDPSFPDIGLLKGIDSKYFDLTSWISHKIEIDILYSLDYRHDCMQADRVRDFNNISFTCEHWGNVHNVLPFVIKDGTYFNLVKKFAPINANQGA